MNSFIKRIILFIFLTICISINIKSMSNAYYTTIVPEGYTYKTLYSTPVYITADFSKPPITNIDHDIKINVTGITDTGFYQIDLAGTYYVPVAFINVDTHSLYGKDAIKDFYKKIAEAYIMQLETSQSTITSFIIKDITGDLIPELISSSGREIYTYYDGKPAMIYYSDTGSTFYYNKSNNMVVSSFVYNKNTLYQIYSMNYSLLPWGQLYCIYPTLMGHKIDDFKKLDKYYTNSSEERDKLAETLYSLYVAGSI